MSMPGLLRVSPIVVLTLFFYFTILWPLPPQNECSIAAETKQSSGSTADAVPERPPYLPIYRIPLRIHIGKSEREVSEYRNILNEINDIWWSQAGICFEMDVVKHDRPLGRGIDVWFMPDLKEFGDDNGYFRGDHEIYVRDTPILGPSEHPAHSPTARTTAHELGHALGLHHGQDSDDNLMRSKTYGWHLSKDEIKTTRKAATAKALQDTSPLRCGAPVINLD